MRASSSIQNLMLLTLMCSSCFRFASALSLMPSLSPCAKIRSCANRINYERSSARRTFIAEHNRIRSAIHKSGTRTLPTNFALALVSDGSNASEESVYDLIIMGAGPVGVSAACKAATAPFNKRVCLVDAPRASGVLMDESTNQDLSIGGPTGLFSKALRDTSKRIRVASLKGMGLRDDSIWNEIITSCVELAATNAQDILRQLEFSGVTYVQGFASFESKSGDSVSMKVELSDDHILSLRGDNVLIATGSKPFLPEGIPFDGTRVFDSDSINQLSYLPKSIAITGSGIIAVEFAKIFRNLGSDVTLIIRDNIPRNALMKIGLDKDVAATLVADLVRSGIHVERGAQVTSFEMPSFGAGGRPPITLTLQAKGGGSRPAGCASEIKCDAYLAAVGRKPNTSNLNLDAIGIEVDEYGGIKVNSELETSAKNIYAAGDVLGRPFLASTGLAQGVGAIDSMFDVSKEPLCSTYDDDDELCMDGNLGSAGAAFDPASLATNPFAFPVGVWSSPEAAYYGLSMQQASKLGIECGEGVALYAESLRGRVFSPNGLLKLVYEKATGRILGVHICGDDACELVHYGMELVRAKRTLSDVVKNLYSAVTFHELYRIAALAAMDEATARKRRAAVGAALAAINRAKIAKAST